MPRNGSGVFSLPAGSLVSNGDVSDASDLNTPLQDIEADLNTARPVVAGGTGATSAAAARVNLGIDSGISTFTATTSGTAFDFASIPSGVVRIDVLISGVSLTGTNSLLIQLGDSGGFETTGYNATGEVTGGGAVNFATGFGVPTNGAATGQHGVLSLVLADAATNTWACTFTMRSGDGAVSRGGGTKSLSATLDRVRVTRSGLDSFDAGNVSVRWSKT